MTPLPSEYITVNLTKGQCAKVYKDDFESLPKVNWYAQWNESTKSYYAFANHAVEGKSVRLIMHRLILGLEHKDNRQGDHINLDTLDNRRDNLRIVTRSQNMQNKKRYKNNTTGFKGVYLRKESGRYRAIITVDGKRKDLGNRDTAEAAYYELWVPAALLYHGEFANLGEET